MERQPTVTSKGFKVFELSLSDFHKLGTVAPVCDYCNKGMFTGTLICALGHKAYCDDCFIRWHNGAKNYPEDAPYEYRVSKTVQLQLSI